AQLEQAIRTHMEWRRQQQDEWRWSVWEYVSGSSQGRYAVATFGHKWGDFDNPKVLPWVEETDNGSLTALCETAPVIQFFEHLGGVSRAGAGNQVPNMAEVAMFQLHFGKSAQFYETLPKFAQVMDKYRSSVRFEWFELLDGGETPLFMVVVPQANWSGFDNLKESVMDQMVLLMGKQKALALLDRMGASVKSQRRDLVRLRQDLSYSGTPSPAPGK
ncbi:MAG TPA: hypothetical protein DCZ69_11735, partial [Syntrophobacteraceae bacterium]|nr:hypothetical protein [Syntrophobacteraceae bacterium]